MRTDSENKINMNQKEFILMDRQPGGKRQQVQQ